MKDNKLNINKLKDSVVIVANLLLVPARRGYWKEKLWVDEERLEALKYLLGLGKIILTGEYEKQIRDECHNGINISMQVEIDNLKSKLSHLTEENKEALRTKFVIEKIDEAIFQHIINHHQR